VDSRPQGIVFADGQRIVIGDNTDVLLKPNGSQKKDSIRQPLAKRHSFCTLPEASAAGVIRGIRKSTESMAAVICFHQPTPPSRKTVLLSTPDENPPFRRSKIPQPRRRGGLQLQPAG